MFDFDENGELLILDDPLPKVEEVEVKKKNGMDIWKILNNICSETTELEWDTTINKTYNKFLINRALSADNELVELACELNKNSNLTNYQHYKILFTAIPKKKRFLKFLKESIIDEYVTKIADYYEMSIKDTLYYINMTSQEELAEFIIELNSNKIQNTKKSTVKKSKKNK
jgi:hypothetical protein